MNTEETVTIPKVNVVLFLKHTVKRVFYLPLILFKYKYTKLFYMFTVFDRNAFSAFLQTFKVSVSRAVL
jgi:hypothetical protein